MKAILKMALPEANKGICTKCKRELHRHHRVATTGELRQLAKITGLQSDEAQQQWAQQNYPLCDECLTFAARDEDTKL